MSTNLAQRNNELRDEITTREERIRELEARLLEAKEWSAPAHLWDRVADLEVAVERAQDARYEYVESLKARLADMEKVAEIEHDFRTRAEMRLAEAERLLREEHGKRVDHSSHHPDQCPDPDLDGGYCLGCDDGIPLCTTCAFLSTARGGRDSGEGRGGEGRREPRAGRRGGGSQS